MSNDPVTWFVERVIEYTFVSFSSWANFSSAMGQVPEILTDFDSVMAWPYLAANFVIAFGIFALARSGKTVPAQSFRMFVFPRHVYRHPSAVPDYWFSALSIFIKVLFLAPIMIGIAMLGDKATMAVATGLSWKSPTTVQPSCLIGAAFGFFLLYDLMNFLVHYLFHKIPMLWSFHVVHHSAEVLTPITAHRTHPVEHLATAVFQAPVAGLATIFYQALSTDDRELMMIFGVSMSTFLFALSGRHLRHSHIWLSYGPVFSWLFISPAQHQIHHSIDPRHRDMNFGARLAVWDALFGTLYVPREPETLQVGLPDADPQEFSTVCKLYFLPFKKSVKECISLARKLLSAGLSQERCR